MSITIKPSRTRSRVVTQIDPEAKSKVLQSEKKHADINNIVARAKETGQLPVLMGRNPITELPDSTTYLDMMNKVVEARQSFERLPSGVRNLFDNDPAKLLATLDASRTDEKISTQLRELGILNALPPAPPETKTGTTDVAPDA